MFCPPNFFLDQPYSNEISYIQQVKTSVAITKLGKGRANFPTACFVQN